MKFGVCGNPEMANIAADAGYDFAEWSVPNALKPLEPKSAFQTALKDLKAARLPYPVLNGFVPADLKITGPSVDSANLQAYVSTAMERAAEAAVEVIVFGSGGARRIPDGFAPASAHDQLLSFCTMAAEAARIHGVVLVVEPLNRKECNVLTTVSECAALVREVNHTNLRLLVDSFHLSRDNDSYDDVVKNGSLLSHVHVATTTKRLCPGAEEYDISPFFNALAKGGYTGRVSIEGKIPDPPKDLPVALAFMKNAAKNAN